VPEEVPVQEGEDMQMQMQANLGSSSVRNTATM
jgi:hypothetical protein